MTFTHHNQTFFRFCIIQTWSISICLMVIHVMSTIKQFWNKTRPFYGHRLFRQLIYWLLYLFSAYHLVYIYLALRGCEGYSLYDLPVFNWKLLSLNLNRTEELTLLQMVDETHKKKDLIWYRSCCIKTLVHVRVNLTNHHTADLCIHSIFVIFFAFSDFWNTWSKTLSVYVMMYYSICSCLFRYLVVSSSAVVFM